MVASRRRQMGLGAPGTLAPSLMRMGRKDAVGIVQKSLEIDPTEQLQVRFGISMAQPHITLSR